MAEYQVKETPEKLREEIRKVCHKNNIFIEDSGVAMVLSGSLWTYICEMKLVVETGEHQGTSCLIITGKSPEWINLVSYIFIRITVSLIFWVVVHIIVGGSAEGAFDLLLAILCAGALSQAYSWPPKISKSFLTIIMKDLRVKYNYGIRQVTPFNIDYGNWGD